MEWASDGDKAQHDILCFIISFSLVLHCYVLGRLSEAMNRIHGSPVSDAIKHAYGIRYVNYVPHLISLAAKLDTPQADPTTPMLHHWSCHVQLQLDRGVSRS